MPIERRTGVCTVANVGDIPKLSVLLSLPSRNCVVEVKNGILSELSANLTLGFSGLPVILFSITRVDSHLRTIRSEPDEC